MRRRRAPATAGLRPCSHALLSVPRCQRPLRPLPQPPPLCSDVIPWVAASTSFSPGLPPPPWRRKAIPGGRFTRYETPSSPIVSLPNGSLPGHSQCSLCLRCASAETKTGRGAEPRSPIPARFTLPRAGAREGASLSLPLSLSRARARALSLSAASCPCPPAHDPRLPGPAFEGCGGVCRRFAVGGCVTVWALAVTA